jgi:hypothetical protein
LLLSQKYNRKKVENQYQSYPQQICIEIDTKEYLRVLKPDKFCAILIGDTRRNKFYIPLAFSVMARFLKVGFALREDIIKVQHNCKATGFRVKKSKLYNFLLIMHEHLFVFQKSVSAMAILR